MKTLVTGGGGFLGRYIVEKLVARGDEVISLSRNHHPELDALGVRSVICGVEDREKVVAACEGVDAVFHVAAKVGVGGGWNDFYETNVNGTRNVIHACRKNGVKRLVFTSSPSVVFDGRPHEGIDETYPYPEKFLAHYPHTKSIAERDVLEANGQRGLLTCALRPHLVWGPRDTNLIPRLLKRSESGRLRIIGDGTNMIDTVYVENAADAHIAAVDKLSEGSPVCGSAYFITQGQPVNCWEWINRLLVKLGRPPVTKKVSFNTAYAAGAALEAVYYVLGINAEPPMTRFLAMQLAMSHYFSIDKARKELGYNPAVSAEEGLERLAEWMRGK
ncbi:MAG: NAD-dependent epimerase/dehydratase family protein [Nitrospinae bacterium]|nr:NAD-dependent epimerase/dehydratase family protein [Nitrospinota bacterium]